MFKNRPLAVGLISVGILLVIIPLMVFVSHRQQQLQHPAPAVASHLLQQHFFGGFGISTASNAVDANSNGIQTTLLYGHLPPPGSPVEQKLKSLNMTEIDGYISSILNDYECHKSKVLPDPADHLSQVKKQEYCQTDKWTYLTDDNAVIASISAYLQSEKNNPLIVGYWVLDDQASWDTPGYAINILNKTHDLIQQMTPGKPAICGFGGGLAAGKQFGWLPQLARNFTAQGCDMVGWYVYAEPQPTKIEPPTPIYSSMYDWTMSGLLASMAADLKAQGWDMQKEPLIGIPQGFSGPDRVAPSVQDMQTQAESFCKFGAQGIIWYAWDTNPAVDHFPWNNSTLKQGVQQGVKACQDYWNTH